MNQFFEVYQPSELVQTYRIINTPGDLAKKSLFYVQETGYLKSIKSHISKRSHLNSFLFIIVLSGKGTFMYKDRIYSLKQYDCLFIDCMEKYNHCSNSEAPWELLWVHFNGHLAKDYYQYFTQINDNVFHTNNPDNYIQLINNLIYLHKNKNNTWEFTASKLLTDLLTECINNESAFERKSEKVNDKMLSIKEYLDQHYKEKINLDDLAVNFYISKYHLSREFKRIFGSTIIDYITLKRITNAKEMLRFTNHTIEEIASISGYLDASYFNKVFRKFESMTSSEYRKRWKG